MCFKSVFNRLRKHDQSSHTMRASRLLPLLMAVILISCQARPAVTKPTNISVLTEPTATQRSPIRALPTSTLIPTQSATSGHPAETPLSQPIDFSIQEGQPFADVPLKAFQPVPYRGKLDTLPIQFDQLGNFAVIQGLTAQQKEFLRQNGFVVIQSGDRQFKDLRRTVSTHYGQPYYLTTDAAYHALHKTFDDLLATLDQQYLRPVLGRLLEAEYSQVSEYVEATVGQPLSKDVELAKNYLAVALKLLYPEKALDSQVEARIALQIVQIMQYGGKQDSLLIPGLEDDYGAYRPVSHYSGIPALEAYFRCMTWLGRVAFQFKNPDVPELVPSRAPLIMTLAQREANVNGVPAYEVWLDLYHITNFMVGPSDDPGPVEINALMEQVFGPVPVLSDLMDENQWQEFLGKTEQLPAPKIDSTFASFSAAQEASRDWRFMGQRFTLDGFIFQNMIFDKVGTLQEPRGFPSGLDVAAAFGSPQALEALDAAGETRYVNFSEQMNFVRKIVNEQPEAEWHNRFYSAWLYAFRPQVSPKDSSFPPYMRTIAWGYKDVNSLLGSWAELKHDTVLYAKMPEGKGGGGPPTSGLAPAYVEPNPNVFYRLAYPAASLYEGLSPYIATWDDKGWGETPSSNDWTPPLIFYNHHHQLGNLAEYFNKFGEIAERELKGEALTQEDYGVIQTCLELKDCKDHGLYTDNPPEMDPFPVIAAVSGYQDSVLEAGVGYLNRIYVAVPLEGKLEIAQGGVFSYYEFTQPRTNRLTDQAWIEMLETNPPAAPAWTSLFVLPGGQPTDALAFRVGDVYILTEKGYTPPLNMRAGPSTSEAVLRKLDRPFYLTIKDGPVKNSEGTWWKIELYDWSENGGPTEGWVVENQEWFIRSTTE